KLLGDGHRFARREAQAARCLLLHRARREGRRRVALALAALDGVNDELRPLKLFKDGLDGLLVGEVDLLPTDAVQPRAEAQAVGVVALGLAGKVRLDGPVLLRREVLDLTLALDDQPHGDRLHAARRQARADLLPQQRTELVAHQPVEDAARLLRVDQVHIDAARALEGLADRVRGDLVEHHAACAVRVDLGGGHQVPGNRLAFAVEVGCQVDFLGLCRGFLKLLHQLALVVGHAVARLEVVLDVNRELRLEQVTHVPDRSPDLVALAQVVFNGARLRRGLDNHELATPLPVAALAPVLARALAAFAALAFACPGGRLRAGQTLMRGRLAHAVERRAAFRADALRRGLAALCEGRLGVLDRALRFTLHTIRE